MDAAGNTLANRSVPNSKRCIGAAHLAEELIEQLGWSVTLAHPGIVNPNNPSSYDDVP
jgi:hypothetical protein